MSFPRSLPTLAVIILLAFPVSLFADSVGTVLSARGEVRLHTTDGERLVTPGMTVEAGARIEVGRNGEATILLNSGEPLLLPAGTTTTLTAPEERRGILSRGLANLWESVTAKLRESEATHAALGTVGAIRGDDAEGLENFDYLPGEGERHDAEIAAIEERHAAGVLGEQERALLLGVTAEKYERYATAEEHYRNAISPAIRSIIQLADGNAAPPREAGPRKADANAPVEGSQADGTASLAAGNDALLILMLIDLYAKNGLHEEAAALAEIDL